MIGDYRPGYAKTRGQHRVRCQVRRRQSRELLHNQIELRKFLARESFAEYRRQRAILLCEQRQVAFRSADVTRKDHRSPVLLSVANLGATLAEFFVLMIRRPP